MRKPRQPNRTPTEKIEDGFMDLSIDQQVRMLETLNSLHRHAKRMTPEPPPAGKPRTGAEAEAAGRADHAQSINEKLGNVADWARNGALPRGHEE